MEDSELFDVSNFKVEELNGSVEVGEFTLRDRLTGAGPLYVVNRQAAIAICQVTYSRLCDRVGLDCTRSMYGKNPPWPNSRYVGVTAFDPHWTNFEEWRKRGGSVSTLSNADDYYGHRLLCLLAHQHRGEINDFGYIFENGRYIKSGNGHAFSHISVQLKLIGNSIYPTTPVAISSIIADMATMRIRVRAIQQTAQNLSNLSDSDITAITSMPAGTFESGAQEFLYSEISRMRSLASEILDRAWIKNSSQVSNTPA